MFQLNTARTESGGLDVPADDVVSAAGAAPNGSMVEGNRAASSARVHRPDAIRGKCAALWKSVWASRAALEDFGASAHNHRPRAATSCMALHSQSRGRSNVISQCAGPGFCRQGCSWGFRAGIQAVVPWLLKHPVKRESAPLKQTAAARFFPRNGDGV